MIYGFACFGKFAVYAEEPAMASSSNSRRSLVKCDMEYFMRGQVLRCACLRSGGNNNIALSP
jgi:hypothetical protein